MTVSELIKILTDNYQYYYSGPLQEEIYSVQTVIQGESLNSNILYVTHGWRDIVLTQNICLLSVPETEVAEIVDILRKIVINDYRRNVKLGHLGVMAAGDTEIEELCSVVCEIMGNPVCFLNSNFQVLLAKGEQNIEADALKIRKNLQEKSITLEKEVTLLQIDAVFPYRRILVPVYRVGELNGYLYVAEINRLFLDENDKSYAKQIGKLLSLRDSLKPHCENVSEEQRFLAELIEGTIIDEDLIRQKMKHFSMCIKPVYYIMSVNLEGVEYTKTIKKALGQLMGGVVYEYKNYGVALIGRDDIGDVTEKDWPGLIEYLKESGLYAGVSNGFLDLRFMPNAYVQSIYAVLLRRRLTDKVYLSFYREVTGQHMYHIMSESGIDVSVFCDPAALQIEQYDKDHGTQYLNSLVVYICLNCSLQQAADVLFIHKNTLLKHIRVFEERFHIDFSNHRVTNSLRRTLEIFSYLKKIDVQKLLGNEQ